MSRTLEIVEQKYYGNSRPQVFYRITTYNLQENNCDWDLGICRQRNFGPAKNTSRRLFLSLQISPNLKFIQKKPCRLQNEITWCWTGYLDIWTNFTYFSGTIVLNFKTSVSIKEFSEDAVSQPVLYSNFCSEYFLHVQYFY